LRIFFTFDGGSGEGSGRAELSAACADHCECLRLQGRLV